jgi:carboxylate-amine ligase
MPARELIRELIEWFIGDMVDELGTRKEVEYAYKILAEGSSADRQLAVYERTGDLNAVVDHLIAESEEGVLTPAAEAADASTKAPAST